MGRDVGTTNLNLHKDTFPGIYRAKVEDNNDPSQLGRIKVRIYPMLADVEAVLLPWAVPMYPIWEGAGTGIGFFAIPDVGTYVFVMFEQGDIYQPVYIGEAPTGTKGLPTERTTNYPNRKVWKTSSGLRFIVDDTAKQIIVQTAGGIVGTIDDIALTVKIETAGGIVGTIDDIASTVRLDHPTGTYILVDTTGKITAYAVADTLVQSTTKVDVMAPIINLTGSSAVNINPV